MEAKKLDRCPRAANRPAVREMMGEVPSSLSPREREVLELLVEGLSNKEIAQRINWSVGTVKNAMQRIIEKLGVSDRTQAAVYAVRAGLVCEPAAWR